MYGNATRPRARRPLCLLLAPLALLSGCATANFVPTGGTAPARSEDCPIEVFSSQRPDRAYVELGILEGQGSLGKESLRDVLPELKKEACRAGGDAIILGTSQISAKVMGSGDGFIGLRDELNVTATVIRWTGS